mgnify:CR=1 FL=1
MMIDSPLFPMSHEKTTKHSKITKCESIEAKVSNATTVACTETVENSPSIDFEKSTNVPLQSTERYSQFWKRSLIRGEHIKLKGQVTENMQSKGNRKVTKHMINLNQG